MPVIRRWAAWSATLFTVSLGLGLVVAHTGATAGTELRLDRSLQDAHTGWLTAIFTLVTDAASPPAGVAVIAVWTGVLALRRHLAAAARTFAVLAVGWNVSLVLKTLVGRDRPPMATEAHGSYPSGHVSFATACLLAALFLARGSRWQRPTAVVGPVVVATVMFSRIYLGAHYLTDTVGAVVTSSAAVVLLTGVWPAVERWWREWFRWPVSGGATGRHAHRPGRSRSRRPREGAGRVPRPYPPRDADHEPTVNLRYEGAREYGGYDARAPHRPAPDRTAERTPQTDRTGHTTHTTRPGPHQ